ncbi:unnamed protein product [Ixodes persulcatus]
MSALVERLCEMLHVLEEDAETHFLHSKHENGTWAAAVGRLP